MGRKARGLRVGQRVFWNDPDGGTCSGPGKVVRINGEVVSVAKDDGGEVECYAHELSMPRERR